MSSVLRSPDEVAVTQESPVGVDILRIDDVLDFFDQVRQFVRPPLHALFENMIKALTAIVFPSVASRGDVVAQEVHDSTQTQ